MGQTNYWKFVALVAFAVFAAVSCWATVESLYLTLEDTDDVPKWILWVAVVGLFILTSYCTKVIVDSLNQNIFLENRGVRLTFGVLGVLVLWLCFSMPTNSHTFFYKKMAKNVASAELTELSNQIGAITNPDILKNKYDTEWRAFEQNVNTAYKNYVAEVNDYQKTGHGELAEEALCRVEDALGIPRGTMHRLTRVGSSQSEITKTIMHYQELKDSQLDGKKALHYGELENKLRNFEEENVKKKLLLADIDTTIRELDDNDIEKEPTLKKARKLIQRGYNIMGIEGNPKVYSSERLTNVTKVWGDYLGGKFSDKNYGLIYWILLSVLVDIAAFVFFSIAFKKD
ncbi:MAG: hypothetical protein K2F95_05910 [Alistipes sp.]|nr:hypothetical protein [Alistipes sp.]